ncbi:MAG: hypothetical protein WCV71_02160 [Patescibacteria group bacterium]
MNWWLVLAIAYALLGFFFGLLYSSDIVSLLRRARHEYGPPSDQFCIVSAGLGVFVAMLIFWPLICIGNGIMSYTNPHHLRLNGHRIR